MAIINNSDLKKNLIEGAKIQIVSDEVPSELGKTVVPTMEVNPALLMKLNVLKTFQSSSTGGFSAYTVPLDKDFYLTNLHAKYIKDVVCDTATGTYTIQITPAYDGKQVNIYLPIITLLAQEGEINLVFNKPILLKRGTTIYFGGAFGAGILIRTLICAGYTVED